MITCSGRRHYFHAVQGVRCNLCLNYFHQRSLVKFFWKNVKVVIVCTVSPKLKTALQFTIFVIKPFPFCFDLERSKFCFSLSLVSRLFLWEKMYGLFYERKGKMHVFVLIKMFFFYNFFALFKKSLIEAVLFFFRPQLRQNKPKWIILVLKHFNIK